MKLINNLTKKEYDAFVEKQDKSHFLQSYNWGEFAQKEKNLTPHYLGFEKNKKIVAATLLLEKHLPLGLCYLYAPRGFVIDYKDATLLKEVTEEIKKFAKSKKAIFVKLDPDLVIKRTNYLGEEENPDFDRTVLLNQMKSLGYHHLGFTQKFEAMQPRFSFRINNKQSLEEIFDHFSKTTKQRIKKAEEFEVEVKVGNKDDIKDFYHLMRLTENRKDFVTHNEQYYQTLYEIFKKEDKCNLFIGSIDLDKIIKKKEESLKEIKKELTPLTELKERSKSQNNKVKELEKEKDKLELDQEKLEQARKEHGNKIILNGHFIIEYGNKAWVLYAGNHNVLSETYANYKTYYEHIKYYHEKVEIYDQFGTVGTLKKGDTLEGLHEFKKKFGGNYVEFIGEFDLILNKVFYFGFTKLVPCYRNIIKMLAKKKNRRDEQ